MFRRKIKGICNNTIFRSLYLVHLICLLLNRHIFMYDADTSLACHRDRHAVFRNRIHARAHHRNIQLDILRQMSFQANLVRYDFRVSWYQ